jgi:beta-glucosidase
MAEATELVAKLSLESKVALLTGHDFWNVIEIPEIGLRKMLLSDGPAGVRGEFWDERDNSLNLPSGTALGSSWSEEFAAHYGRVLAREAARKGVDVVLGPTINLHRSPLGGRHFECLSEDPMLTGVLAAAYTRGMQAEGKGACPKHYVANDFETDRYNVDVRVDERTLNEVYLRPFEDTVVQAGAWSIMSSYNKINGVTASENDLLDDPLRTRWGFDGVVISDWTAVRSLESAKAEQDLVMPGPVGPWGDALVEAVRSGEIAEEIIDRKVVRLLHLALRVGALDATGKMPTAPVRHNEIAAEDIAFARSAVSEGSVLLKNDGILPLDEDSLRSLALIGHNADAARTQGGGSATVLPKSVVAPLAALRDALGDKLTYSIGATVQPGIAELPKRALFNPASQIPGARVEFLSEAGETIFVEDRLGSNFMWLGANVPLPTSATLRISCVFTPELTETRLFGFASPNHTRVKLNGEVFIEEKLPCNLDDPFLPLMDPPFTSKAYEFKAGVPVAIEIEVDLRNRTGLSLSAQSFIFGFEADASKVDSYIQEAALSAKAAEVAVVVVGTNSKVESEGFDRKDIGLPGRQNELVEAVLAANPNTIVIVNSGSPVELPWRNRVRALLLTYFGGQEMGNGIVDMLFGRSEPGGRLPTTWPAKLDDAPVTNCEASEPGNYVNYEEGLHIGYRAWLRNGVKPAYEFGFGLGYTSWTVDSATTPENVDSGSDFEILVQVTNTGSRSGQHVVQVYASKLDSQLDRPVRWLVGFTKVEVAAKSSKNVAIKIRGRELAHFNNGWQYELGTFDLMIGSSSTDLPVRSQITVR